MPRPELLLFILLLHALYVIPGQAFPQRNKRSYQGEYDPYHGHYRGFAMEHNAHDPARMSTNHDYRYNPIREEPTYIPPIFNGQQLHESHYPQRKRSKQSWYSTYENHYVPGTQLDGIGNQPESPMQGQEKEFHQPNTDFLFPSKHDFNVHLHPKMEDIGSIAQSMNRRIGSKREMVKGDFLHQKFPSDYEEFKTPIDTDDYSYDTPEVVEALTKKEKPELTNKEKSGVKKHSHKKPTLKPSKIKQVATNEYGYEKTAKEKSSVHQDDSSVVEVLTKKEKPAIKDHGHKKPTVEPSRIKHIATHEYNYDRPVKSSVHQRDDYKDSKVVEALTKKGKPIVADTKGYEKTSVDFLNMDQYDYPQDYETPMVMEALTKKGKPVVSKGHAHKRPGVKDPSKKKPVVTKDYGYQKPEKAKSSVHKDSYITSKKEHSHKNPVIDNLSEYEYEDPVVVEALTKKNPSKEDKHKKPIVEPSKKGNPGYEYEDYGTPVVVEALTKNGKPVVSKGHTHKKPGVKDPPKKKPVVTKDYGYQKPEKAKSSVHKDSYITSKKEHSHKNPVMENLSEYEYEDPVVAEALTKKNPSKEDKHKKRIVESSKKGNPGYEYEEYDTPIVVEALTNKEKPVVSKKPHTKVKPVVTKKNGNKPEKENLPNYKEYNYETSNGKEHKVFTKNQNHEPIVEAQTETDLSDYEYDTPVVVQAMTHEGKPVVTDDDSKGVIKEPSINVNPVTKESDKKPEKGKQSAHQNNYENMHSKGKMTVAKKVGHKPLVKTPTERYPSEYDYDSPVVVEARMKRGKQAPKTDGNKKPNVDSTTKVFQYDYETPVVVDVLIKKEKPIAKPQVDVKPAIHQNYEIPVEVKPKEKPIATKMHSHVKQYDYKIPMVMDTLTEKGNADLPNGYNHKQSVELSTKRSYIHKGYKRRKMKPQNVFESTVVDNHERPIDKVTELRNFEDEMEVFGKPEDNLNEMDSVTHKSPLHTLHTDFSEKGIVVDHITLHKENPGGHDIPLVEAVAIETGNNGNGLDRPGVEILTFNHENEDIDVINVEDESLNHEIEDLRDSGSGMELNEISSHSVIPRSFLPLSPNSWSFMTRIQAQERRKFKSCITPKNEIGNCMPIQICSVSNIASSIDELLRNVCIIDEVFIGICCPEFPVEKVRVDWGQFVESDDGVNEDGKKTRTQECGKLPSSIGDQDTWPWTAPLVSTSSEKVFCGGALINEQYVLTAAHCTTRIPRNQILVRLGRLNNKTVSGEFAVVEIKRHAQYNPRTMQNDIALLKLAKRVPLGKLRRLVCLPDEDAEDYAGETAVLLPWEESSEGEVESLPVISNKECQNRLGSLVGDSVICVESRNEETNCNADSGAPLVISKDGKFKIIGVLTWNRNDCDGRFPTVFTRISSYRRWIQNHAT